MVSSTVTTRTRVKLLRSDRRDFGELTRLLAQMEQRNLDLRRRVLELEHENARLRASNGRGRRVRRAVARR